MQRFACPNCNKPLKFADEFAGRDVNCPKCGSRVRLPGANAGTESEPTPDELESVKSEITSLLMEALPVAWAHPMLRSMIGEARDPGTRLAMVFNAAGRVHADIDATLAPQRLQKACLVRDTIRDAVRQAQAKVARALPIAKLVVFIVPAILVALIVVEILASQKILPESVGQAASVVLGVLFLGLIIWLIVGFARWVSRKLGG